MMKSVLTFLLVVVMACFVFAGNVVGISSAEMTWGGGIGLGSILAIVLSWSRNSSVLWAIIHALFGWLYVIYFVISR